VISIIDMSHIIDYLASIAGSDQATALAAMRAYRARYGV
jgi:hypothetical protein